MINVLIIWADTGERCVVPARCLRLWAKCSIHQMDAMANVFPPRNAAR